MVVVSGTRLQARRWKAVPFLRLSMAAGRQAEQAEGFVGGALLKDRRRVYWTVTLWESEDAMRAYRDSEPHKTIMTRLGELSEGFASTRWTQESTVLPSWYDVHDRLRVAGRVRWMDGPGPDPLPGPRSTTFTIKLRAPQ